MKTIKIFFTIALIALATAAMGQRIPLKQRLFPNKDHEVVFRHADYRVEQNRLDTFIDRFRTWTGQMGYGYSLAHAPRVTATYHVNHVDVVYDLESSVENWMTVPFDCSVAETGPAIESWMGTSFESSLEEELESIENWMAVSFQTALDEQLTTLESWMTVPFENALPEESTGIESWMASPFVVEEPLEIESWMAASWN